MTNSTSAKRGDGKPGLSLSNQLAFLGLVLVLAGAIGGAMGRQMGKGNDGKDGANGPPGRSTPIGTIVPFAAESLPDGWLLCDGAAHSRSVYEDLFGVIEDSWGEGDGSTTFNVPDLRGRFLRGVEDPKGSKETPAAPPRDGGLKDRIPGKPDGDRERVGSIQEDALQVHEHQYSDGYVSVEEGGGGKNGIRWGEEHKARTQELTTTSKKPNARFCNETRPKNAYVNFIIKAKNVAENP